MGFGSWTFDEARDNHEARVLPSQTALPKVPPSLADAVSRSSPADMVTRWAVRRLGLVS